MVKHIDRYSRHSGAGRNSEVCSWNPGQARNDEDCYVHVFDETKVDYIRYGVYICCMINANDFFDALSDETRRRLLALLVGDDELCVCELCYALDLPQPKVSRHLAVMRESGVLSVRREGLWIYYRIHPLLPAWAYRILDQMGQGCAALAAFQEDGERLKEMPNRPARCCA